MRVTRFLSLVLFLSSITATAFAQDISGQISYATTAPTIDGFDDDEAWSLAESYSDFEVSGGAIDGDDDLFTVWKALWDEDNFYAHVTVVDDVIGIIPDNMGDWNTDSVEFYFDATIQGLTTKLTEGDGAVYDYQADGSEPVYQLTLLVDQYELHEGINHTKYLELNDDIAEINGAWIVEDSSYQLEIAFPWTALGSDPGAVADNGSVMGFGVAINDEDDGAERDGQAMWATSDGSLWHDATKFPLVELSEGGGGGPDPFPGDANGDGKVDATDLNIVGLNWQKSVDPGPANGDFDNSGFVDATDLNEIGVNWLKTAAAPVGAAVPEPTTICLLGLGIVALSKIRRRRG